MSDWEYSAHCEMMDRLFAEKHEAIARAKKEEAQKYAKKLEKINNRLLKFLEGGK